MKFDPATPHSYDKVSLEELALYHQITDARTDAGLDPIEMSLGLSTTAGRHTADWIFNIWGDGVMLPAGANLHSWSDAYYYSDHRDPKVMWDAPERAGTSYTGTGFEISASGYTDISAALTGWMNSAGHRNVILNQGTWSDDEWNALGVGVAHAVEASGSVRAIYNIWFGRDADNAGAPKVTGTGADEAFRGTVFGDIFVGKGGSDTMTGAAGDDLLKAGGGADAVRGGTGADVIKAGGGRDSISGGDGADTIRAGGGRDKIDGGAGDDALFGGGGRDTFVFSDANFGADTIADIRGREKIIFDVRGEAGRLPAFRKFSEQNGDDIVYDKGDDGVNTITFEGLVLSDLDTLRFDFG